MGSTPLNIEGLRLVLALCLNVAILFPVFFLSTFRNTCWTSSWGDTREEDPIRQIFWLFSTFPLRFLFCFASRFKACSFFLPLPTVQNVLKTRRNPFHIVLAYRKNCPPQAHLNSGSVYSHVCLQLFSVPWKGSSRRGNNSSNSNTPIMRLVSERTRHVHLAGIFFTLHITAE